MRAPQERTMRDLYDRTRHKDLAAPQEPAEGCVGGRAEGSGRRELVARMEDKSIVRKKLVSNDNIRVKAESGTCNVCCAPCSSCLHRSLAHTDSNIDCGSSQTCSTRSEIKNNSLTRTEKGFRNRGENDDEFSAASSNASYSETGGNKVVSRSSIAEDSEVDMPAKRRRLSNEGMKLSRTEYLDGNNSCVTGMPAEGKLLKKKRLSTSASSRDLTIKDRKDNSVASLSRLRKQHADESTEKNRSDVMHLSSSVNIKKLIRTQSSVSVSKGLSPKRQVHELGEAQENLSHEHCEKASISNNIVEQTRDGTSNPFVDVGDNNVMLTGCSGSMKNEIKARLSPKNLEIDSFSKDQIQQHAIVQINDDSKKNGVDKQERDQDSSMDICNDGKLNRQNDVMTDCGNSEGLIDVNVCDICGDVGREYLLATCTRCLEGAEHTYCMRVKLDRVPDGEWLCEECQLKDDHSKTKCKYDVRTVSISEGKKQSLDSQNSHKTLRVVVPNLDTLQINCNTPTADQCDAKKKKLHLPSADTLPRQVKVTNPAAERLEARNKNLLSMANRKKLQVVTSDLEAQSHTSGIPTPGSSNKKNQSSEFQLNRKKLRVSTDTESPLSSEGLRSPSISCKRLAENTSSPTRLFTANNLKKRDVFSRENSFKKSNEGNLSSLDNASVRNSQAVKSSQTLSRSYSMGSMLNSKAPVPSPRGILSKQLSFNSSNNGPKVKQLAEGIASKLKPVKHSPKDPRDQGPIKKLMKSGSFKSEGSVCKDAGSSKQKHSFHVSQDEKPVILKSMKEKNLMERRASFNLKKPNIPSSPRPESYMKSGERKLDQDIPRPGPSILKSSKRPGNVEKESFDLSKTDKRVHQKPAGLGNVEKGSSDLSKTDKHEISVHQKPVGLGDVEKESSDLSKTGKCETSVHQKAAGFISAKVIYTANVPDPPVPPQCVKRESNDGEEDSCIPVKDGNGMLTEPPSQCVKRESNDGEEDSSIPVKDGNEMPTEPPEVLPTTSDAMSLESDLQDIAPRVSASEELASKVLICQPKPLDSTLNSCNTVEAVQFSDDTLSECPHGLQIVHNGYPTDNKLDKPNLKQEALFDQSTPDNPSRDLVIPEQSYIWQGSFEVSRRGIPELFDGIQAYLSTCASFKVREVGKQLPHRIRLEEVPRHSSWPLQFKGVNPTEDNIALFFFAKDAESYERAYKRLLEDMLLGDLSLTANIDGTELLIFPSDKLPERTQRWNGLLFFWGIFYAHKASSLTELSVSGTNSCPLESVTEPEPVVQHDVCSPKVPHPLVIDLNQCPIDDLSDPAEPLGSEMKKTVTSIDQNIWLESKLEDRKLDACEIHQEETAGIRQIVSGHPTAAPCRTHFPKFPTDSRDMVKDYPSATKDTTGIAGNSNMEEEGFCQHGTLFCVPPQAGAIKSVSGEMVVKKQAFQPSVEASPRHFSGSKISNEPNKLAPNLGTRSSDSDSSYKRQKTSHGKYSACSFEELPNKCLSKIHPLPDGERNHDAQYIYRGHSDPASLRKPIPDHVIHVLSSDDEDSPEPSTSLNKASLKADAGSSPLLSLSLSTVATKHNLAGSDIGEDEPLSLSLGLPGVVDRSRVLEMKQFLPEKPGINT